MAETPSPICISGFAVNGRCLERTQITGVERYTREVLARVEGFRRVSPGRELNGALGHAWEQLVLPGRVRDDFLWSPANTGPLAVRRQVVTLHDASVLDHPEWFTGAFARWYRTMLPVLAKRARLILTVSQYSRERLLHTLRLDDRKIVAVPCGVDARFRAASETEIASVCARLNIRRPYFLSVGSVEPRKNLETVLKAWDAVRSEIRDTTLVVTGGTFAWRFRDVANLRSGAGVQAVGYVPDADLPALYSGAVGFLYPSLYEGFGLPPLEAMACGVPVIASNTASLPEVLDDAAILVPPLDVHALAASIASVAKDASLRADLRARGLRNAKRYSWDFTAQAVATALATART